MLCLCEDYKQKSMHLLAYELVMNITIKTIRPMPRLVILVRDVKTLVTARANKSTCDLVIENFVSKIYMYHYSKTHEAFING